MLRLFPINCPMLNKLNLKKIFEIKNAFVIVILVPSLECILISPLPMIETLNLFPK